MYKLIPINKFFIYVLRDPRTGEPRYIGQSSAGLKRPKSHQLPSSIKSHSRHLHNWITQLKRLNMNYEIVVIERFFSSKPLNQAETYWISTLRKQGYRLLNISDGGGTSGLSGKHLSDEHKSALRIGWQKRKAKGLLRNRESYRIMGLKTRGRKQTSGWIEKRTQKLKGRNLSEEQKTKISYSLKGKPASLNTAANLRKLAEKRTPEYTAWLGRKGAAHRWKKEFTESEPMSKFIN
jgi:hypothetical protein